jgi:hypothetical protein
MNGTYMNLSVETIFNCETEMYHGVVSDGNNIAKCESFSSAEAERTARLQFERLYPVTTEGIRIFELNKIKSFFYDFFEGKEQYGFDGDHFSPLSGNEPIDILTLGINLLEYDVNSTTLTIHLSRPGFFIGKRGNQVDIFRKLLSTKLNKIVKINLVETDVFKHEMYGIS